VVWYYRPVPHVNGENIETKGAPLLHLVHSLHLEGPWSDPQTYVQGLGPAPLVYSVYLIWQAGMAFVIGLVVKLYRSVSKTKGLQR
jgi:hypothetical protein